MYNIPTLNLINDILSTIKQATVGGVFLKEIIINTATSLSLSLSLTLKYHSILSFSLFSQPTYLSLSHYGDGDEERLQIWTLGPPEGPTGSPFMPTTAFVFFSVLSPHDLKKHYITHGFHPSVFVITY